MCTSAWSDGPRVIARMSADALRHNVQVIQERLRGKTLCAVIKANAYGHGAIEVARILDGSGLEWFSVATIDEALELRKAGLTQHLLVMGITPVDRLADAARENISIAVHDCAYAEAVKKASADLPVPLKVHIKLDTGMTRLGFSTADAELEATSAAIHAFFTSKQLIPEGLFSHFAASESDALFTKAQVSRFKATYERLSSIPFSYRHIGNSGAVSTGLAPFNMSRVGILLYGGQPDPEAVRRLNVRPVMSLLGRVVQVRTLTQPESVGYGRTAFLPEGSNVAIVEMGYADGVPRSLSGIGYVLIKGKRVPFAGRVSMDRIALHTSGLDVRVGDLAMLFGEDHGEVLSADTVAGLAGTISYELFCHVAPRVPRIWIDA